MTDAKSATLELALRAVQQHLERDEYTEAGEVVRQALMRVEQVPAPDLRATFRDTMDSLDLAELAVQQTVRIAELEKQLAAPAQGERQPDKRDSAGYNIVTWLRVNANAEKEPKARAAFIEAHNAALAIFEGRDK